LANEIAAELEVPIGKVTVKPFADGEIYVNIDENVRGCDVFVIQPTCKSVNHNLVELAVMIDALRRASAGRITAVIPYYGYARQDRKAKPREPITAKLVANLLAAAGTDRVLTIDLHSGQIQGFFDIPLDHLYALPLIISYFQRKQINNLVVVSPDSGGAKRASRLASSLNVPLVVLDKRRPEHNKAQVTTVIGDVKDKNAIIIDDMIDTAGTIAEAVKVLKKNGANDIYVAATHGIFSPPAVERLNECPLKELIMTNTIPFEEEIKLNNVKMLSVAKLLADAIKNIHTEGSVSGLGGQ
jgi:ribose-phosphate pyrophosphokinase